MESKTIKVIQDFYDLIKNNQHNFTDDEEFFVCNKELFFAKCLIQEFGSLNAKRLAKIILSIID